MRPERFELPTFWFLGKRSTAMLLKNIDVYCVCCGCDGWTILKTVMKDKIREVV